MFGFFVGLFGGAYYGGRYLKEKSELRAYDRAVKSRKEREEYFNSKYVNRERQFEIYQYIVSGNHFDEICETLKEELIFIFGEDYKNQLLIPPRYPFHDGHNLQTHSDYVLFLLLAKEGLVHSLNKDGYILSRRNEINRRFLMVLSKEYAKISSDLELCEVVNHTVQTNLVFRYTTFYDDKDLVVFI